eukprot:TRINITY_DN930_c0_g2_i1.p1 TRINITY_DN930_c0_g2~~TRINITY_DN930_c0_g2_i1.p1  ORF type:complete len:900 (-),score=297.63 TRINITY_DN930_c0_g2_i1:567-3071(-)
MDKILANARKAAADVMDLGVDDHNLNFDEKDLENDPELLAELGGLHEDDDLGELEDADGGGVGGLDAKIQELEGQVKALQIEAVQHKRSGDRAKALEVMKNMKAVKAELENFQAKKEAYEKKKAAEDAALESEDPELLSELKGLSLHGDDDELKEEEPAEVDYDAQIAEWQLRIKKAGEEAINFKKSGQKDKALQAMKHYKALQEKFLEFKQDVDQLRELKDESAPQGGGDFGEELGDDEGKAVSPEDQKKLDLVHKRIKEYQKRAVEHKRNGSTDIAKQILLEVKKMQELAESLEIGEGDIKTLPKPISERKEYAVVALSEDSKLSSHNSSVSEQSSVTSSVSAPSKGVKAKLEYQAILTRLSEQFNQAEADVKTIMETAKGQPQSELPAIKRRLKAAVEIKARIIKDLDLVKAAAKEGLPPPVYHIENVMVERELYFPDIKKNEMVIHVKEGSDFKAPDGWTVSTSILTVEFGLPSLPKVSKTSGTFENDDNPKFDFKASFVLPPPNKIGRSFKFAKVDFKITSPRMLLGAVLLGEGEMKIGDLTDKCEIESEVPLKRKGRPVGKLNVVVRIRQPFKGKDIREVATDLLVIDHFHEDPRLAASMTPVIDPQVEAKVQRLRNKSSGKPEEPHGRSEPAPAPKAEKSIAAPTPAVEERPKPKPAPAAREEKKEIEAPVQPKAARPPPPAALDRSLSSALISDSSAMGDTPAEIEPSDWKRPHNMDLLVSNDVLQAEFDSVSTAIATARAKKLNVDPSLEDRYKKCQLKMMLLQSQVEDGELTLPMYLQRVKDSIVYHTKLIKALKAANRLDDAKKCLARLKVMQDEVHNAENSE